MGPADEKRLSREEFLAAAADADQAAMNALETEYFRWRVAMDLHATPEQSDMLIRCQKIVAEAFPAHYFTIWCGGE